MFWIEWTCPVLFGDKQSRLTFSIKTVPSGHMLSISSCLYEEFTDYKTFPISELPDTALTDALIASYENHDEYCLDTIWYHFYQMKSLIGSDYRFCNLFNVARLVLVTPHSNAGIERVYSLVNKN